MSVCIDKYTFKDVLPIDGFKALFYEEIFEGKLHFAFSQSVQSNLVSRFKVFLVCLCFELTINSIKTIKGMF